MPILVLACVGLVGMILGIIAFVSNIRRTRSGLFPSYWLSFRWVALLLGIIMAFLSWYLALDVTIPIETPEGTGQVVGIPFFALFLDHTGRDYIWPLTPVAGIANCIFWFLLPQMILFMYGRTGKKTKE